MNSEIEFAGTLGETYIAHSSRVTWETGAKSLTASKGGGLFTTDKGTMLVPEKRSVYPSGDAVRTAWAAIAPSAPGLFSMTNVCPSCFDNTSPMILAATSEGPPAGKGTSRRTGLDG